MIPIQVETADGRAVCRGFVTVDGDGARAHLRFAAIVPPPAPLPGVAHVTVEHIRREVAVRIRVRRRREWITRQLAGLGRAVGALAMLLALALMVAGVVWLGLWLAQ